MIDMYRSVVGLMDEEMIGLDMYRSVARLMDKEMIELDNLNSLPPEVDVSLLVTEHTEMKTMYEDTLEWFSSCFRFECHSTEDKPLPCAEFHQKLHYKVSRAENAENKARSEHKWNELGRLQAIRMGRASAYRTISNILLRTKSLQTAVQELKESFPNFNDEFVEALVTDYGGRARELLALYDIRAHCVPDPDYVKAIEVGIDAIKGESDRVFSEPEETLVRSVRLLREDRKKRGVGILSEATTCAANCIESLLKAYSDLGRG